MVLEDSPNGVLAARAGMPVVAVPGPMTADPTSAPPTWWSSRWSTSLDTLGALVA